MVFTAPNPEFFMETLRLRLGFNTDSVRRLRGGLNTFFKQLGSSSGYRNASHVRVSHWEHN